MEKHNRQSTVEMCKIYHESVRVMSEKFRAQERRQGWRYHYLGFCDADVWTAAERDAATGLLRGLEKKAAAQRHRLEGEGRRLDADSWLWL